MDKIRYLDAVKKRVFVVVWVLQTNCLTSYRRFLRFHLSFLLSSLSAHVLC